MILVWDAVTTDCNGGPDVIVGYLVLMTAIWVAGWYDCGDPPVPCPIYAMSPPLEIAQVAGTEFDMATVPPPPVGGVDVFRIESVDWAGNTSGSDPPCVP